MLDVKLVKIDSTQVDWDRYNSSHHSPSEAPSDTPYEASYAYNQWLNLIQRSQNVASPGCNMSLCLGNTAGS